jgi:hypothetical protein
MSDAALTQPERDEITGLPSSTSLRIELPLSSWRVVLEQLNKAAYQDVVAVINEICGQGDAQLRTAQAQAGIPVGRQQAPTPDSTEARKH